jgi:hypothetical protein
MFALFHVTFLNKTARLLMYRFAERDGVRWTAFHLSFWRSAYNRLLILLMVWIIITLGL